MVEQEETNKYISSNDNANVNANANANANVKNSNDDVDVSKVLNIAVVGGGIGGSSVAHFTSKLFQTNPELFQSKYANISITVFEASPRVSGNRYIYVYRGVHFSYFSYSELLIIFYILSLLCIIQFLSKTCFILPTKLISSVGAL